MKTLFQFMVVVATVCFAGSTFAVAHPVAYANAPVQDQDQDEDEDQEDEEESLQEQVRAAFMLFQEGEYDEALEKMSAIYDANPEDERIGLTLIQAQQQAGSTASQDERVDGNKYYYASGKTARKVMKDPDMPEAAMALISQAIYNEACSYGVDGKNEKAMEVLKEAFELGFEEFDLAAGDSDFGDLLETEDYKNLIAEYREKAKAKALEKIKEDIADFESFDFDFETENMDGDEISVAAFKGQLLIVDFWGTWCPPCRKEIPHYIELRDKYDGKLEIVGLAYERGDEDEAYDNVVEFMEDNEINYQCALGDEDTRDMVPEFRGYPTTLFIDGEGKVRYMKVGASDYATLELIVEQLLK